MTVNDLPPTDDNIAACGWERINGKFYVTLADRRRKARSSVRLYRDKDGTPFINDRLHGRRNIVAVRFIVIDGKRLQRGSAVAAQINR